MLNNDKSYKNYMLISNYINKHRGIIDDKSSIRLAILRNFTVEPLVPVLEGEFLLEGFVPEIYVNNFDNINQDILNDNSDLYNFSPEIVIIIQWLEILAPELFQNYSMLDSERTNEIIERVICNIDNLINTYKSKSKAPLLINNFPITSFPTMSALDAQSSNSLTNIILKINSRLIDLVKKFSNVYIVDFFSIFLRFGFKDGFDKRNWYMASAPLGKNILIPLGQEYIKFLRFLKGKQKKCLVLDCDETLWGGIVGEAGFNGIQIGNNYPGICYKSFQYEILNLYNRGIILALCSKNNEHDVIEVLNKHDGMVLREEHFSTYQINWDDKATNIARIAKDLNIGVDSIVFMDDSEFECNLIKERLPEVSVINLPKFPSLYKEIINTCGLFDSIFITEEDRIRTKTYKDNIKRKKIYEESSSIDDYLSSLSMEVEIGKVSEINVARISQMTQKTNQFNLTTKRYTEEEILEFIRNNDDVFYLKVKDNISDMGIVGTVIIKYINEVAYIDTFLLSCRVIGRNVEYPFIEYVVKNAYKRGCSQINGRYNITSKNNQVSLLYKKLGFDLMHEDELGSSWRLMNKNLAISAPGYINVIVK